MGDKPASRVLQLVWSKVLHVQLLVLLHISQFLMAWHLWLCLPLSLASPFVPSTPAGLSLYTSESWSKLRGKLGS